MLREAQIQLKGSRSTLLLIGFLAFISFVQNSTWKNPHAIRHDMLSYYGYLPATFIHGDLTLSFVDSTHGDRFSWASQAQNGRVFRMTMGVALIEAPFFMIADGWSHFAELERNGYSPLYVFFLLLGSLFYFLAGLFYLNRSLQGLFDRPTAFWTCVLIAFATNLYYYTIDEGLMSHVFSFFLYSALLYFSLKWHRCPSGYTAFRMGLCLGLLILIRPIHICAILLPLGLFAGSPAKWGLLGKHSHHLLLIAVVVFLCWLPQLVYWKFLSGEWLYYSYHDEGFFFNDPQIWRGLFGFRKGWFVYTPVMLLAIPGLFLLYRHQRFLFWPIIAFLPLFVYVVFSWWCWWYGGSYGSRSMIDIYAWMALPIGASIFWVQKRFPLSGIPLRLVFLFLIYLSIFQTRQYRSTLLHWDGMNAKLFAKIWMEKYFPENYGEMLTPPDYEAAKRGERDQ